MKVYFALPLKDILHQESELLQQAEAKASKIRERTIRKSL
jgi:heptose I phosphotransferase